MKYQIMILSQVLMLATLANARFLIFPVAAAATASAPSGVQMTAALPTESSVASEEPSTLYGSSVSAFKTVMVTVTHHHHPHYNGTFTRHRNGTASHDHYTGTAVHDHHNATATHNHHNGTVTHHCTGTATHSHHHQNSGSGFASGSGRHHVTRSFSQHSRPSSLPGFTTLSGVPVISASGGFAVDQASNTPSPSKASPASTTNTMSTLTTGGGYDD
ncbi:hypothetical protein V8E51_018019 [Hyaloscypha variabilis]